MGAKSLFIIFFPLLYKLISFASCSSLVTPPKSALVVAFEFEYELSSLANTLSDEGISTVLIVSSITRDLSDPLIEVDVIGLNFDDGDDSKSAESRALIACEVLLTDESVTKKIEDLSPTYVIFPALRHDACLLPWAKKFGSIPVIWTRGTEGESYAFQNTGIAWPIFNGGFWSRLSSLLGLRSILTNANDYYVSPALKLVDKYLPSEGKTLENLYTDVDLVFWGGDTVLRYDVASVSQMLVEIGCHHCRGAHPVPAELQKELVEYRTGTIAALLDKEYKYLLEEVAKGLPQGRQGQALAWKNKNVVYQSRDEMPENLFLNNEVIRQDLVGYPRTRVLLSHCEESELLEAGFHGTPVICFPRNVEEEKNARRAVDLGFSLETNGANTAVDVLSLIKKIHETSGFRENARKVSMAIRDRPNPTTDRITYWLGYVARNKYDKKQLAKRDNRKLNYRHLFNIDIWLTLGFIAGLISGALLPSAYILAGKILADNKNPFGYHSNKSNKRKYKS